MKSITDLRLQKLAYARKGANLLKISSDKMLEEFKSSPDYKNMTDSLDALKKEQAELRAEIEEDAQKLYALEGDKKMFNGLVGMRITKQPRVGDTASVRAWVMVNAPLLLEVNQKSLVNMAKSSTTVPEEIVSIEEVQKVTIASDLSKLLDEVSNE